MNGFPKYQSLRNCSICRSIIFQFARTFRTIGGDLHIMSLQKGEINDGANISQFKGFVCKYFNFIPQAAKQKMSSHCH